MSRGRGRVTDAVRLALVALAMLLLAACSLSASDNGDEATATPLPSTPAPGEPVPVVAWAEGGDLFTWRAADPLPRRIASGGVIRPLIAPDGDWVAYLRGPGGDPRTLWISDTPGANERQLLDSADLGDDGPARRINQVTWTADGTALYLNTLTGVGIDTAPADDLWRVDAGTGATERLLPDGQGGQVTLSPDGTRLALASAGDYAQPGESGGTPGVIAFYDPATGTRTTAFEFPAVATGSERRWYPALRWSPDGTGVYTAIPPADLVYGGGEGDTALWWLPWAGEPEQVGAVAADFFGLPVFSADGAWIAYFAARPDPQITALALVLAHADGSGAITYDADEITALTVPAWLREGDRFVYGNGPPGTLWLGQPGVVPGRFPAEDVTVAALAWAGPGVYVVAAPGADGFTLGYGRLDAPAPLVTIATSAAYPFLDATLPD